MSGVSDQRSNVMERRINMGDFVGFADDIENGMAYLEHHQILGAKWGQKNGPPYPLGSGDHSSAEKSAAQAAGVKVGSDSGKGSIENVKKKKSGAQNQVKKPKKEMTDEEKREAALKAVKSGDKKKIAKYAEYLTSQELQDADNRVRNLNNIQREEPGIKKASKADVEKQEAIRSGDKEKVKEYADKMTYSELAEAMNKVNLMQQLNHVDPPKSAMDKLTEFSNKVDQFRQAAEKGIGAYNVAAAVYNSTHKGGAQWPIIEKKVNEQKSKESDVAQNLMKQMSNDVQKGIQQTQQKSYEDQMKERYKNAQTDYKYQKKLEDWTAEQEAKRNKGKEEKNDQPKTESSETNQRQYTSERAPEFKKSFFNTSKKEATNDNRTREEKRSDFDEFNKEVRPENYHHMSMDTYQRLKNVARNNGANAELGVPLNYDSDKYSKGPEIKKSFFNTSKKEEAKSQEPTEDQKRLVEEARKSDDAYLKQLKNISNQSVDSGNSWKSTWKSVEEVQSNRPISDDLTPAEEAFLNSFKR